MPATCAAETTREGLFASTGWTMVLGAGESQTPPDQALSALSELCRIYWRPIFLFLRRQGSNPHDAQDLTQGFFAHLIESRAYARADPEKGRFRSFLLGALKHFVAHARTRSNAEARRRHDPGAARHGRDRRGGRTSRELADLECRTRLRTRMGRDAAPHSA